MARDDWQDREDERRRAALRGRDRDDFGQADYSQEYGYDPERGGYRRYSADDPDHARRLNDGDHRPAEAPRSWLDRAGAFFSTGYRADAEAQLRRRRGPSDRVLWAVIVERLEEARGLDLRAVEVIVEDAEVTLNGRVRRKLDRRRIEDIADIDGVRHVQNNLRVHDGHWTFL